jgi:hypothetical protein
MTTAALFSQRGHRTTITVPKQKLNFKLQYFKKFSLRFIFKYVISEERDDRVLNAMRFFNAYLKGAFVPFIKDVVVISGPGSLRFKIWEYEDTMGGELELLSRLTSQERSGCFALPGKGFWSTSLYCWKIPLLQSSLRYRLYKFPTCVGSALKSDYTQHRF